MLYTVLICFIINIFVSDVPSGLPTVYAQTIAIAENRDIGYVLNHAICAELHCTVSSIPHFGLLVFLFLFSLLNYYHSRPLSICIYESELLLILVPSICK